MKFILLETYICTDCGHFEEYIPAEDLKHSSNVKKIKETWKKV